MKFVQSPSMTKYKIQATDLDRLLQTVSCPICNLMMVGRDRQPEVQSSFIHLGPILINFLQACSSCYKIVCSVCATKVFL